MMDVVGHGDGDGKCLRNLHVSIYMLQHACAEIKLDGPSSGLHLETINVVFVCRHSRNYDIATNSMKTVTNI
jgi:hypothetical protein